MSERNGESSGSDKNAPLKAWGADVALRGDDAPKNDGSIKHLIQYLLTVYERFGNTAVTCDLQWGATALWKGDAQKERIAELEHERNVLQKICAERSDEIERLSAPSAERSAVPEWCTRDAITELCYRLETLDPSRERAVRDLRDLALRALAAPSSERKPVYCNTGAGHWFPAGGDRCAHCGKTPDEVGLTITVSHERSSVNFILLAADLEYVLACAEEHGLRILELKRSVETARKLAGTSATRGSDG